MSLKILTPVTLGALLLKNRLVMAPLTRSRAGTGNVPHSLNATYYAQRASAGLIVSEATQIAPEGVGYLGTPGIHSAAQIAGWRPVTDAVHEAGGKIVLQLWHVGRISHPDLQPGGKLPVSSSAVCPAGNVYTANGKKPFVTPRALEAKEIPEIVAQYGRGAENAKAAGFDGVEVHGANGYLIDQFLRDGVNRRTDQYGGSVANRARLALEVLAAVCAVWGPDRVGIRFSPNGSFNDMSDSNPAATYGYLLEQLNELKLAYVHLTEPMEGERLLVPLEELRVKYNGKIVSCGGYTLEKAEAVLGAGLADAVAFGKLFLANPDLPRRFELGAALNAWSPATFYGGGEKGYTDYPVLNQTEN